MIYSPDTPEIDFDKEFFETIYCRYMSLMRKIAYEITHDYNVSDDLVHDAFIKLADKLDLLQKLDERKRMAYIARTIRSISLDYNKKVNIRKQKKYDLPEDPFICSVSDSSITPMEEICCINETCNVLNSMLCKLSIRDYNLLVSKYILNLKDNEISEELDIPTNNVRQYLTRARRRACKAWENLNRDTF